MLNDDIEIGIKIVPTIYLTIEEVGIVPFNVDRIIDVIPSDNGSIVKITDLSNTYSSSMASVEYHVINSYEKVKETLNDAYKYKEEGLKRIKELLKNKEKL